MYKIYADASDRKNNIVKLYKLQGDAQELVTEVSGEIDIIQTIKDILHQNSIEIQNVDIFESFPGPGSFTGLKKSFAITNTLNWALGIKKNLDDATLPDYGKEPNIG
jgi:tRNA A37 threonylcarbamoyladenosine modification protein TsaB